MNVNPANILPSQSFLKPDTLAFILECIKKGKTDKLPPNPIVRKDSQGNLVAIDGHNLIAVKLVRNEDIEVHLAKDPDDGLPETTDANIQRNQDLKEKFETVLEDRRRVEAEGIKTFHDLVMHHASLLKN